jgi:3-hydroxyacyl-CoA dehydrogenase / enoyl-CoA hydratase / 3-hydroxybutyryl-CoA epimerase
MPGAPDIDLEDRLILPLVNTAVECLQEKIVEDADAVDAGLVFGAGFPPFRGGPIHYAQARGVGDVLHALRQLQTRYGERFGASLGWEALMPK